MKHGEGKYLYLDKGQIYTGVWSNDIAKCGSMEDYKYETNEAPSKPDFPIPEVIGKHCLQILFYSFFLLQCKLKDYREVLRNAAAEFGEQ